MTDVFYFPDNSLLHHILGDAFVIFPNFPAFVVGVDIIAVVVDDMKCRYAIRLGQLKVILAISWSYMNNSCTRLVRYKISCINFVNLAILSLDSTLEESQVSSNWIVAFIIISYDKPNRLFYAICPNYFRISIGFIARKYHIIDGRHLTNIAIGCILYVIFL